MKLNQYIDHTLLKPEATTKDIEKLCHEAKNYQFATVCVNPSQIAAAKKFLKGSKVKITTVIGFPLGAQTTATKVFEAQNAVLEGADEIDMVLNLGALKEGNYELVFQELQAVRRVLPDQILKVICEVCLLTEEEIIKACELAVKAKADFVKTSTGFNRHGATIESVALMKKASQGQAKVKAAGGIKNYAEAMKMIENGADRLGTSGGVAIIEGQEHQGNY